MVEYAWRGRAEEELASLSVLVVHDGVSTLKLRVDGWEFQSGGAFLDLMAWGDGTASWQALLVGKLEPHYMPHIAGFLLDRSQGWGRYPDVNFSCEPGCSFSTQPLAGGDVALTFYPYVGGAGRTVHGEPALVTVGVSASALIGMARWFYTEALRFASCDPPDWSDWPAVDPATAADEVLIDWRRQFRIERAARDEVMIRELKPYYEEQLKRTDLGDEDRRKLESLIALPEHFDWRHH